MTTTDSPFPARRLGASGPEVFPLGLGAMGMSALYGPTDRDESIATVHAALDAGMTLIDTGDFYGMGDNELLLADALRGIPRDRYQLSVKFGAQRDPAGAFIGVDNSPAALKTSLAYSLRRLGVDHVDIYRPARLDPSVPIEETVGAVGEMVQAGYVRHIGLSEVGADTLRRAAAAHPISDLQIEYSLISRSLESTILPTARELGIGITAYGVLAQGLLSGGWQPAGGDGGRAHLPRFAEGNVGANLALVERLREIAAARGATVAQLAVAWVLAQGRAHGDIVALVGARRPQRIAETLPAAGLKLTDEELAAIELAVPRTAVAGERYAPALLAMLDSEP
jgi:aryl-alcohol dehydrogenase-like predicted oxidoreductase